MPLTISDTPMMRTGIEPYEVAFIPYPTNGKATHMPGVFRAIAPLIEMRDVTYKDGTFYWKQLSSDVKDAEKKADEVQKAVSALIADYQQFEQFMKIWEKRKESQGL